MRRRVARRAAGLIGAVALLAVGCTAPTPDADPTVSSSRTTPVAAATTPAPSGATTPTVPPTAVAPLVVDTVFDHTTLDPPRQLARSGLLVSRAVYQTLTTLDPDDPTRVVPGIAEYTLSPEGRWLTMRLRRGVLFSDGSAVSTDDVIFSLERAQGLRGTAATVLGTLQIVKVDDRTFTISSPAANFALPAILANPAFGILNARAVKANGGTIGPGDTASPYLSASSAGSGPYMLKEVARGRITLAANPAWTGTPPAFPEVVLRDVPAAAQLADVRAGRADVALDLSPAQAQQLVTDAQPRPLSVQAQDTLSLAFLTLNRDPKVDRWTSDPHVVEAVRRGLDVAALARLAGDARPASGLVPSGIVGSLEDGAVPTAPPTSGSPTEATGTTAPTPPTASAPATRSPASGVGGTGTAVPTGPATGGASGGATVPVPTPTGAPTAAPTVPPRDLAAARAALARSGYRGQPLRLTYAVDVPIAGIQRATIAAAVRAQLAQVGLRVVLDPQPASRALAAYRAGRSAFSLWSWTPDYPDPENYLAFAPGELVGARAGWDRGRDPGLDDLTDAARQSVGDDRSGAYAAWQVAMNERGPFVPLLQPMGHVATGPRVKDVPSNPVWTVDLARIT